MSFGVAAVFLAFGIVVLSALSTKWELPRRISALMVVGSTLIAAAAAVAAHGVLLPAALAGLGLLMCQIGIYMAVLLGLFFRDPTRKPPEDPGAIVSPADGSIIYIRRLGPDSPLESKKNNARLTLDELAGGELAGQELWQIGISMAFTDVHVNRSPIAGRVTLLHKRPGKFLSLKRAEAVNVNERQTLVIVNQAFQIAVVQIASRLVRQIQAFIQLGESVTRGQRIGMIRFGSQVDVLFPVGKAGPLEVTVGQRLLAGQTTLAHQSQA